MAHPRRGPSSSLVATVMHFIPVVPRRRDGADAAVLFQAFPSPDDAVEAGTHTIRTFNLHLVRARAPRRTRVDGRRGAHPDPEFARAARRRDAAARALLFSSSLPLSSRRLESAPLLSGPGVTALLGRLYDGASSAAIVRRAPWSSMRRSRGVDHGPVP